jgi:hypothetical protein
MTVAGVIQRTNAPTRQGLHPRMYGSGCLRTWAKPTSAFKTGRSVQPIR